MAHQLQFDKLVNFVFDDFTKNIDKKYVYHSPMHICMVFREASFLGGKFNLSKNDMMLLLTAASLHDYGFLNSHENHEEQSCKSARKLLPMYDYLEDEINIVCAMIMSTKIPQTPTTLLDKILCDADLFYLGDNYYTEIAAKYQEELLNIGKLDSQQQWKELQIYFLENHTFHLTFTQSLLAETKARNLLQVKNKK